MERPPQDPLVSTAWLAEHVDAPDIRILDASWHLPGADRDPRAEYRAAHIPGAVFFDIDDISDETSALPHMLPNPVKFSSRLRKLGLGDGSRMVVYDSTGLTSAARAWWMLRAMGHEDIVVLDGGLPKWISECRSISDRPPLPRDRHFSARLNSDLVREFAQVKRVLESGREQVVDARPAARFRGEAPEPRAGLRSGHMPGALNLPSPQLFAPDGTMWPRDKLEEIISRVGLDLDRPVIASCGSGITACVIALALARLGRWRTAVYDGSWAEWGVKPDAPVATGAA